MLTLWSSIISRSSSMVCTNSPICSNWRWERLHCNCVCVCVRERERERERKREREHVSINARLYPEHCHIINEEQLVQKQGKVNSNMVHKQHGETARQQSVHLSWNKFYSTILTWRTPVEVKAWRCTCFNNVVWSARVSQLALLCMVMKCFFLLNVSREWSKSGKNTLMPRIEWLKQFV